MRKCIYPQNKVVPYTCNYCLLGMFSRYKIFDMSFQLAIEHGIKFLETSAKASINVEDGFFTLARDIKAKMDRKLVCYCYLYKPS